ncbi:: DUF4340: DUF4340: DUF4340: DUF4340 [Gemmata massiliana]|uniref:: DUF4340: DUF4340: DUF4340: DUF4340 n=1 Tax=Gemmata massiliana TaxID=1210884 RepID=A0A6P2DDH3_9BACT|nr:DUF4340 domain-containing protein [Gemmata massiliana]VTR99425.1 : DUF4340: DUF4340: DUF4340: DUF4340 [Gemmata massiliana]
MNFRQTAILIGSVLIVGVVLLILTFTSTDDKPDGTALAEELVGVKPEQVDTVELERDGARIKLVRTDAEKNKWELVEPYTAPADPFAADAVVKAVIRAKPTVYPEVGTNPAVRGLDPPSLKVTLRSGEKSSTLNLGDITIGGNKAVVFVTTSSRPSRPMAVARSELDALFRDGKGDGKAGDLARWTGDYRVKSVFPSDTRAAGEDVTSVRLELPNKKATLALIRAPGGAWKFDTPAGWGDADVEGDAAGSPNTFTGVRRLLGALTSMTAATPADFIDSPKDLKEYSLDAGNPDLVKVEMKTKDNQTAVVYFGKREGTAPPAAPPGMPPVAPGAKVYVRIEGQPGVIRATAGDLNGLNSVVLDPSPLRDRTLVNGDRAKVDGIDIVLAGQPADKPTKLRRSGSLQWRLFGPGDPQSAFGSPVERLLDVVMARRTIKEFPAPNPANFSAISATIFVWIDGFTAPIDPKAEPTKKAEPIKIEFGRKDGDTLYVRRTRPGLPPDEFTISAQVKVGAGTETVDAVAAVSKSRLDLLDPSLPTFGSDAVAKITVSGASNYVLDRDEKPDPSTKEALWRFTAPEPKGRTADTKSLEQMLQLLGTTQSVTRFVDEQPADAKLAEYGLTPAPRLKIVIGLRPDSPDKERVYEFGKDTADPNFVYARVAGKTAVFTLPRLVLDKFVNPDLRDRLVFRGVNAAAVNKVVLQGWGNLLGNTPITLSLEKNKDGVWVIPPAAPGAPPNAPNGFMVDPAKVSAFVDLVVKSPVKSFVSGKPEAKHGFANPNEFLDVRFEWAGGNATFRLGASPDNGATYYGETSLLPPSDPVFIIDGALLKPFKERPGGFAK